MTKERGTTEQLLALAVDTGHPAALALEHTALPSSLAVLGRFALTSGGREVPVTPRQGARLLKLLGVSRGRLVADQVIDAVWPDAGVAEGCNRLRTVLSRLRSEVGDVVVRDDDTIALRPDVAIDLVSFEQDARRALSMRGDETGSSLALARSAIARYRGDVLPENPYDEWAITPRERARQSMLSLLDLCADRAAERGDLDEVRRVVELSIELAPYDDDRYLRAASAFLEQGRRGAALTVVRRARSALEEIGLQPTDRLLRIEAEILSPVS